MTINGNEDKVAFKFSEYVCQQLGYYVYRLIDPRKGETFYVGKGKNNRVFAHVKGELSSEGDAMSEKLSIIRDIRKDGFEVDHVIHRHGLDESTATIVEAALIDAYPGAVNLMTGHGSDDFGLMHARQIVERYEAPVADFVHPSILINISRSVTEKESVYEAVRYAWKLDPKSARASDLVMAVDQGLIIGVFIADDWMQANKQNFPDKPEREGRWGFNGREAPADIAARYLRHRVPDSMRKRGAANPIRYTHKKGKRSVT